MKQTIKRALHSVAPRWTTAIMSARARAHSHRILAEWGCGALNRTLVERFGNRVLEGPFAGLTLTPMTYREQIGPYLLGVYESELDPAWEAVLRGNYEQIIDVGAKFGYYAAGLARRYPDASIVAFDTDRWARRAMREMAAANGIDNVEVMGFCSPDWILRNLRESSFVISDCEGYEAVLFNPEVVSRSATAALIVETHDCFAPAVSDRLRAAFEETHTVRIYGDAGHRRETSQSLGFLGGPERRLAVQEVRSPQLWLACFPKAGPNRALSA